MIDKDYVITMAKYNSWQNRSLYEAATTLSDEERRKARGAFFGSIHTTFNHLLWADRTWMARFLGQAPFPVAAKDGLAMHDSFEELAKERRATDAQIEDWSTTLDPAWLHGDLAWHSALLKKDISMPKQHLVAHFFNHETHHRGQVHAMLTMAGAKPEDTDLMLLRV